MHTETVTIRDVQQTVEQAQLRLAVLAKGEPDGTIDETHALVVALDALLIAGDALADYGEGSDGSE